MEQKRIRCLINSPPLIYQKGMNSMSKRWFCFLLSLLLAVLPLAQVSASAVSSPQILYSVNYTPYTEQELLDKAHANVDERSESLKQIVSMIPRAEVSGDSVAFARNASSPEYATQLLSRKVFDNGTTEETYAANRRLYCQNQYGFRFNLRQSSLHFLYSLCNYLLFLSLG